MHTGLRAPRWLTPHAIVLTGFANAACALAAVLMSVHALPWRAFALGEGATGLLALALARFALGPRAEGRGMLACFFGTMFCGSCLWWFIGSLVGEASLFLALGSTIGLVPSALGGSVLFLLVRSAHTARSGEGSLGAVERVAVVAGACAGLAGAVAVGFVASSRLLTAVVPALVGLILLAWAWQSYRRRHAWLRSVYAGDAPGWAVVPLEDFPTSEHLSQLVPTAAVGAVLVSIDTSAQAYRAPDRPRPVALVPSELPRKPRSDTALIASLIVALAGAGALAQHHRVAQAAPARVEPIACIDARRVFELRAEQVAREMAPVGSALMVTAHEDHTLAPSQGVLYLARGPGEPLNEALKTAVREALLRIPCSGKLDVTVGDAQYRIFSITAQLTVREGEDKRVAAARAREILTGVFLPGDESVFLVDHVNFGYYDKGLRWRVRAALGHVEGLSSFTFQINGAQDDVVLGRAELPVLRTVTLTDGATGAALE